MASKKTVTFDNLLALGAERLAGILVELADGDAEIKRRLRLEIVAQIGGEAIAAEIAKRLTALKSAKSFVDWQKRRDFVNDLDLQRAMIVDKVAPTHAALAVDLMWRFMDLAEPVINRVDDSNGSVGDVFKSGCEDLGAIAAKANSDPAALAARVFVALSTNDYGIYDSLVPIMLPALGEVGIAHLKRQLEQKLREQPKRDNAQDWRSGAFRRSLQDIADGQGDVDAYIALVPIEQRDRSTFGAEIGRRLLTAGRAPEALAALEKARPRPRDSMTDSHDWLRLAGYNNLGNWEEVYIDALDATGQGDAAQQLRWSAFESRLSAPHLRAYLDRLSGFDDVLTEEKAIEIALGFQTFSTALSFLKEWSNYPAAARLIVTRNSEINGDLYYLLDPTAQWIESKDPLAATLLHRAMIEHTLANAKSTRYKHAARHLLECASLAPQIHDFGSFETHDAFTTRLRAKHGRKVGFWAQVT
jgi:hypothetical protein